MRRFFLYVFLIFLTCVSIEIVSFSYLLLTDKSSATLEQKAARLLDQHPWRFTRIGFGFFDPNVMQRYVPGTSTGVMKINEFGFIANNPDGRAPKNFPEKDKDIYRIFLLGGSSLAGNALRSDNSQTIAAYLERMLNAQPDRQVEFEVLNFGVSGAWTYSELRRFLSEIVFLQPDMVITLDGWNDAVAAALEHVRQPAVDRPALNWHQLSYMYFEYFNGFHRQSETLPAIFTYSYLLLKSLGALEKSRKEARQALYSTHHWHRLSRRLLENPEIVSAPFEINLDVYAAYAAQNNIRFLAYLQPFAEYKRSRKVRPEEEEERLVKRHKLLHQSNGIEWSRPRYREIFFPMFQRYEKIFNVLEKKYAKVPTIRFFDITAFFENQPDTVYLDQIHYNELGNKLLAERFAADISASLRTAQQ